MKWNIRLKNYYLAKKANKIDTNVQKYEKKNSWNASEPKNKEVRSVVSVRINVTELLHPLIWDRRSLVIPKDKFSTLLPYGRFLDWLS